MSDTPPDRLSVNSTSPYFDQPTLERGIGIRFKGVERRDVEEYSISEGWIRVQLQKKVDRHGQPLTIKLNGPVEAWYETPGTGRTRTRTNHRHSRESGNPSPALTCHTTAVFAALRDGFPLSRE